MKRKTRQLFKRVIAMVCAVLTVFTGMFSDVSTVNVQAAGEHTLWVVGDSTVSAFSDAYYYPRYGYGTQLGNYLNDTYTVQNLAVSGTSSKSFTTHANYSTLTGGIKAGDTLVVGFGHNDEKADDSARYTSPLGDYTTEGSFAKSLYDNYIKMAQDAGAEVILCTPIVRRTATTGSWSNNQLHVANDGDYAQVIRDLGSAVSVPVVDLTTLTKNLYDSLGAEETLYLHAWTKNDAGSVDNTHLNIYGAKKVAWLFANAAASTSTNLASAITLAAGEPAKATDLVSNPDFVEKDYDNNLAQSTLWADYTIGDVAFKGTAFGNLGGNPSASNYTFETDANGDMHMVAMNNKGKIASTGDGLIMYYYKVPVTSSFSLSAKATVNSFDANSQVAFGLMARDDMYIDLYDQTIASDYVAAGTLGTGCNCFYRKDGKLGGKAALSGTLAAGNSYNLSIVSNSDGYTCTFGDETPQSAGYDFALTSVDSEYVYIGMFVARNANITFSNIELIVDGVTIASTVKQEYSVAVSAEENGSAKANTSSAVAGTTVNLTATPNAGYYLKEWQVVSGDVTITDNSFIMPAGNVEVKAVFEAYPTSWNFRSGSAIMGTETGALVQGATQTVAGLTIDATASGAKFDSYNRSDWAQVNNGTVITIPVEGASKVTVTSYGAGVFTVDGQAATEKTQTFICTGTDNKVTLTYTANDYLGAIEVVPYAMVQEGTVDFKTSNLADAKGFSGASIVDSGTGHGLQTKAADATLTLTLSDYANVVVTTCRYGAGLSGTMTASSGTVSTAEVDESGANAPVYTVAYAEPGELTLTFASNMYIHSVAVEYVEPIVGGNSITVAATEGGSAAADASVATEGTKVSLTAKADAGYYFKEWQVVSGGVTVTDNSFTMSTGNVEVKAVFEPYRYEWNFRSGSAIMGTENGILVQGKAESFEGLTIDATASGAKFDAYNRTDWAQANAGTVITVPVEGSSKVTVTSYSAGSFSVDGEAATEASQTFFCTGEDNKVTIAFTANDYLGSIAVVPYSEAKAGTIAFGSAAADAKWDGVALTDMALGNSHGIQTKAEGSTITLTLTDKANLVVTTCRYGAGTGATMTASSGEVTTSTWDESGADGMVFTVMGVEAGTVTLTFGSNVYIHELMVEYMKEVGNRNIDVWDLGGVLESDTKTYTNNVTPEAIIAAGINKTYPGNVVFGDLTVVANKGSDRIYTTVEALKDVTYGTYGYATKEYADGYTSAGCYYTNGTGGASRRYLTIANVQAGDKIVFYGGIHGGSDTQFIFEGQGTASAQKETVDIKAAEFERFEFVAEYTGTYKIWENAAGKALYHRVVRVPGVAVSGTISVAEGDNKYIGTAHSVKFINDTTKQETMAVLDGDTFTATLAPGYSYTAVLMDAVGYGFTADSRVVTTTDTEGLTGKTGVNLVIEPKETYTFSGKITGFADGYDVSKLSVTMVPPADSTLLSVDLTIDESLSFTAMLEPDSDYTIQIAGVNDYEVKSELVINKNANYSADIQVGLKPMYKVDGGFIGLAEGASLTALSFENVEDGYTYTADVTAEGYSISLRDGSYQAKATIDGYSTITHVVVAGAAVSKDIMFKSTAAAPALDWVADVYVGYPDKANNYDTVSEAVAACAAMKPSKEEERITVHIAPGTYREQIVVNTPYISFVNDTDEEVLLTWYYGIGYQYYSIDSTGYYNPENAYDQYAKGKPNDWGCAVYIKPAATAFRAEGITFENSFNRYITDEELLDGAEPSGSEAISFERKYGADVQSKAATERAAAVVIKADKVEFMDCSFLSSQDTLLTGNAGYDVYFKNCFIEGQTDYIYGDGNAIFDACELSFKGYSAGSTGGYITAAKPSSGVSGYLFRNCVVTANDELTVTPGYLGRPWGPDAKVMFVNTKLESADLITAKGWHDMSGATPENANFYEYNTTDMNGNAVDTSSRRGKVADEATAAAWTREYYFGDWIPYYYVEEATSVAFEVAPFVTDNGDINTPYPGHTLTVGYSLGDANDANDASKIEWYRVKEGATDVLVKTSYASIDKTYVIASEDIGYQIKVVVTPVTVSGVSGTAASYTVEEVVRDGYENPDASGSDVILGDGVNIFLVGDSTVKDYSAAGIWSGGKARNEGAWGEFFQSYFNDEKVTVVNYANGGRSARNFINEGSLDLVAEKIGEGDYLFIQFGHNDCANGSGYLADRYVPLGEPDANGVYPTTAGTKVATPAELANAGYGDTCYTYDCGGTYKWYLMQYVEVAREAGATPVLVTPVSRMYYNSDGTIKAHHDSTDATTGTQVTSNNAYVTAVKQLAEEQNILLVDGFELTKELFEDAYTACGSSTYGAQIMHTGDKTHNNKLGGLIEAAAIASAIQNMELNISYAVKTPAQILGETTDGTTVFSVNGSSVLTAYDINSDYADRASYWEGIGQTMFAAIAEKAEALAGEGEADPTPTAAPTQSPAPTAAPTESPAPTAAPTESPAPTVAPTEAPTATPSVDDVKAETSKTMDALEELANVENVEELVEKIADIVEEYIETICDVWAEATTVSEDVMKELADVEKQITELNPEAKVIPENHQDCDFPMQKVENALLSAPAGGRLYVKSATLEDEQKTAAKTLNVTDAQLAGAEVFDMTLLDDARTEAELAAPVRVTFGITEGMTGKVLKLVHFGEKTELLDVTLSTDGKSASAVVTSFSEFALIAVADIQQPAPVNPPASSTGNTGNTVIDTIISVVSPKMGDMGSMVPWLVIGTIGLVCVVAAFGVSVQRKKKED
ncbi:MAG: hypothetical protein IJZ82_06430 [Lachnospiraceae bacterium]|nr:hypothetical protein [Lachnospiraceae bacterium]